MIAELAMAIGAQSTFQVRLLGAAEVRMALPIAQLLYPALTEESWVSYANGLGSGTPPPRWVLVACNSAGYLHGLCTLSDGFDLRSGRILLVDDLIVANFLDTKSVAHALLKAVEEMARKGDYSAVRVSLADGNFPHRQAVADTLNSEGHVRTTAGYSKPLVHALQPVINP